MHNVAQKEVDRAGKFVHWLAFRLAGVVPVSISQEVAVTVRNLYGHEIETPVIYNGIPTGRFSVCSNRKDEDDNIILLHVGRFSPEKNHRLLIESFALALEECSRLHLWLVGDGELKSDIEKPVSYTHLDVGIFPNMIALATVFAR